jgi:hypothetical protein
VRIEEFSDTLSTYDIGNRNLSLSLFLDSFALVEVRTVSEADFLDCEGLLAFNVSGVLPFTLQPPWRR